MGMLSKIINKYENSFGIVLWSFKQKRIEVWFFPKCFWIKPHKHPDENIEVIYFGFTTTEFYRKKEGQDIEKFIARWPQHMFKKLSVPHGVTHWFNCGLHLPLIAMNISTFLPGKQNRSAADDFQLVDNSDIK